jgi:hypothetical protein
VVGTRAAAPTRAEKVDVGEVVLLEKVRWTSNGLVVVSVSGR